MEKWKFYLETYGCKVNQYESQLFRQAWQKLNGEEVESPEAAEYIYINSCAITSKAERDARNAIYRLRRLAPKAKIILCGCAAQFFSDFTPRKHANYAKPDFCLEQKDKMRLLTDPHLTNATINQSGTPILETFKRARPIVKIQDGCSQNCAYCIVPQTRNKLVSQSPEHVLAECKSLLNAGFCELMLSGVNLAQYGKDQAGYGNFWDLLAYIDQELAKDYEGRARLRISSLEPRLLTDRGLETLLTSQLICPHLHLSLQHASPGILRRMGRGHYSAEDILLFLEKIRLAWPVMGLGADILVGFPGETDEDLQILKDFIVQAGLTYAHVFPFSARQGTAAQGYPEQIPLKVKQQRAAEVREVIAEQKTAFLRQLLGSGNTMTIAADMVHKDMYRGVNEFYVPCYFPNLPDKLALRAARPIGLFADGLLIKL